MEREGSVISIEGCYIAVACDKGLGNEWCVLMIDVRSPTTRGVI